jgi:hypothetical protein
MSPLVGPQRTGSGLLTDRSSLPQSDLAVSAVTWNVSENEHFGFHPWGDCRGVRLRIYLRIPVLFSSGLYLFSLEKPVWQAIMSLP